MPRHVEFEGLTEIRRALEQLGEFDTSAQFKAAGFAVASEIVIPAAKGKARTRMQRRAADTLKAAKISTGAAVKFGSGFPAAMGAEFGAYRNQRRLGRPHGTVANVTGWNQFEPWRGSDQDSGYFLWPAIRDTADEVLARYGDAIERMWTDE